ncbi:MAG: hypothetical protein UR93_C0026G0005 [Berkelbacteria bacterium GW2011_GWA2_35_9]|uniref:Large ribosomal subunit protein bL33 n=1 Tax=Berkelbacteria bacterium GW2011_GWA2_35_9 TaxID=1618333 RepID=A0A0G0D0W3_9BACT|nr:MAG: hypothetical protein UR93_C0026G0005 [Berkelbacteria bacterium GW2011_GWA2_35_9]
MAKRKSNYVKLKCSECGTINYYVNKSRGKAGVNYKLEKKKHCGKCRKTILHKETK